MSERFSYVFSEDVKVGRWYACHRRVWRYFDSLQVHKYTLHCRMTFSFPIKMRRFARVYINNVVRIFINLARRRTRARHSHNTSAATIYCRVVVIIIIIMRNAKCETRGVSVLDTRHSYRYLLLWYGIMIHCIWIYVHENTFFTGFFFFPSSSSSSCSRLYL